MKFYESLRFKLVVWVVSIVIVGAVAQNGTSVYISRGLLTSEIQKECMSLAKTGSEQVNFFLSARLDELTTISKSDYITAMNQKDAVELLQDIISSDYENMFIIRPDGTAYLNNGAVVNVKDRNYFQTAIQGKKAVDIPLVSKVSGNIVIPIAVPIYQDDKVAGVLAASIKSAKMTSMLEDIKVGQSGYAYLISNDGTFLVHPDSSFVLKKNALQISDSLAAVSRKMIAMESGLDTYTLNGVEKYLAYAR